VLVVRSTSYLIGPAAVNVKKGTYHAASPKQHGEFQNPKPGKDGVTASTSSERGTQMGLIWTVLAVIGLIVVLQMIF
jgi:hypothetical protein